MNVSLSIRDFAFFKVALGGLILAAAILFPIVRYISIVVIIFGKVHSLGAWIAMWRAGKFNWPFVLYGVLVAVGVSYWAFALVSLQALTLISFVMFAFHYIFDEYDLHGTERTMANVSMSVSPFVLSVGYLVDEAFHLGIALSAYAAVALILLPLELYIVRRIDWFFVRTKMLSVFILLAMYIGLSSISVMFIFLIDHYLFWLVYPVYRLHKYNRAERDGFIMLLLTIIVLSVFIFSNGAPWASNPLGNSAAEYDVILRVFFISSIAHILTTAPFTYLFGVSKPRKYPQPLPQQ